MGKRSGDPRLQSTGRIGIVNRAEPAIRLIRAVREYNHQYDTHLETVAFFLDAESDSLFVRQADRALGFRAVPGATQSPSVYMNREVLVAALRAAECDAVWPGWGFVSEDEAFAEMAHDQAIVFLGPTPEAMARLGDKITAKELAERSDVPILPWSRRPVADLTDAQAIAEEIGYPVIVKAAHAGGGRGIRPVHSAADLETQFTSARDETIRITGGDVVFIERLVQRGRHLEVQCLCDQYGTVATFGVRDCSVQRRNQKIIEETPPAGLSEETISAVEGAAARLMTAAEYRSAGTVEFLYDLERNEFYFMEVNTRLQVEHPITEELFGVDLVKGQIDVAMGKKISAHRSPPRGSVVEARLNAEDPDLDFSPSPGTVTRLRLPSGPGVRVDSSIEEGSTISPLFDSMVAKIIVSGSTREEALARLRRALSETRVGIEGGTTNKAFLLELLSLQDLAAGPVHTRYVEEYLASRADHRRRTPVLALVAAAITTRNDTHLREVRRFRQQIAVHGYPRTVDPAEHRITFGFDSNTYEFGVRRVGPTSYVVAVDGATINAEYIQVGAEARMTATEVTVSVEIARRGDSLQVDVDGIPHLIELDSGGSVRAPSPAVVLSVAVTEGDTVSRGSRLLSLEAMKMEMIVDSPSDGTVGQILVAAGEQVAAGQPLVQLDATAGGEDSRKSARVDYTGLDSGDDSWESVARELSALFLGYDAPTDPMQRLDDLVAISDGVVEAQERLCLLICRLLDIYVRTATVFSAERISSEQFARAVSWQELVFISFRYGLTGDALPQQFREGLADALRLYPHGEDPEGAWSAFYHMQRSRRQAVIKAPVVRAMVLMLENLPIPDGKGAEIPRLLEAIVRLNQIGRPALADAALHARYHLYDRVAIGTVRRRRAERTRGHLRELLDLDSAEPRRIELEQIIVDSSPYVVGELLDAYAGGSAATREVVAGLLARYMVRDRLLTGLYFAGSDRPIAVAEADGTLTCIIVGATDESPWLLVQAAYAAVSEMAHDLSRDQTHTAANAGSGLPSERTDGSRGDRPIEVIALLHAKSEIDPDSLFDTMQPPGAEYALCSVGVCRTGHASEFRSWRSAPEWHEETSMRHFSPILYRELRVGRLSSFEYRVVYHSDSVFLIEATATENPKDERLFALAAASESEPRINRIGSIERVDEFDEVFMEAVFKLRNEQARRTRRLFWNRIIVHVRALIPTTAAQIKEYGNRIVPRVRELGLEKAVIYTRRKRWSEDVVRELELLFLNISGDQFTLRSRKPSTEPLKPMDRYVSNVVRSRQRNTLYPYELVKMITYTGYPVSLNVPRGEFEEFDLDQKTQSARSARGRRYGLNDSNVVFGIVRNVDPSTGVSYRRVLVLADSTRDMGSLAEPECRRIIAAIDLAQEKRLPVEWVPISSGARIDMESGTENLDWTAAVLRRIIEFTQAGGEINVIVAGINVGAQSYWNAEATMLMHTRGLLIMTDDASMLLTGKKALDFSGSVSGETNVDIGGVERVMGPNGQAQVRVQTLVEAYALLFDHYRYTYRDEEITSPFSTTDPASRDVGTSRYVDRLGQGFTTIGSIFSAEHNPDRKKPFDIRQVMEAVIDSDTGYLERWSMMQDAETAIAWETRIGGYGVGMIGIESRPLARISDIPHDGPDSWSGGTLFPMSSRKIARALNAWSDRVPVVVLANLSGFDGSPESLRRLQLEYGAEIGRAVTNFRGPLIFVVLARYHGGAYVVFSKALNPGLKAYALSGSFASVLGGAPAAAVVFARQVERATREDPRYRAAVERLRTDPEFSERQLDELKRSIYAEKQADLGRRFDAVHSVERALQVGSIDRIITVADLRPTLVEAIREGLTT
jgi:acetyl/propionyl-CoA carboxylase alpha subunit/acetyl-CoA carboxylase carboxyltransferase component